jgi:hypothetical protein
MTVPDVLFTILARMKALGIDVDGILRKVGVDPSRVSELVAGTTGPGTEPAADAG